VRYRHFPTSAGVAALAIALAGCASHTGAEAKPKLLISPSPGFSALPSLSPLPSPSPSGKPSPARRTPAPRTTSPVPRTVPATPSATLAATPVPVPSRSPAHAVQPSPTGTPSPVSSPVPTAAQLQSALLTLSDLPDTGLQVLPPIVIGNSDASLLSGCPYATQSEPAPSADVDADFGSSLIGPDIITEELQQYPVSVAEAQLQQFAQTASQCATFSTYLDNFHVVITLVREAFPSLGDGAVALSLTADVISPYDLSVSSDIVAVRDGGTVMVITNTDPDLQFSDTESLAETAFNKLAAVENAG
jgi:hypothetical protein